MAVPKKRKSKSATARRRANWKLDAPGFVECPRCHKPRMPHRVCPECGHYDGREVIKVKEA